jgi:ABC-type uncharacterized transport system permease subunit
VFALLALTSAMFLFRNYSLKAKHPGGWFQFLPSILDLDQMSLRLLTAGVTIMTIALGVGWVYWRRQGAVVDHLKLLAVVGVWGVSALTLGLRRGGRLIGKRFAWIGVGLFAAALLSLLAVNRSRHPDQPARPDHPTSP